MGDRKIITADKFRKAWCKVWEGKGEKVRKNISKKLSGDEGTWREWTDCMLAGDNSFLACVAKKLGFQQDCTKTNYYQVEYDRFDMALLSNHNNGYPVMLDVLIEHENDKCPENEMWKLMLRRSPLKVIVFYFHSHFDRIPPKSGKIELPEKLDELREMLIDANNAFRENENTEYLFIIGSVNRGEEIEWLWASDKEHLPQKFC